MQRSSDDIVEPSAPEESDVFFFGRIGPRKADILSENREKYGKRHRRPNGAPQADRRAAGVGAREPLPHSTKRVGREAIDKALRTTCCSRECMKQFKYDDLYKLRSSVNDFSWTDRHTTLRDDLTDNMVCSGSFIQPRFEYHVAGKPCCSVAYRAAYGIGASTLQSARENAREGLEPVNMRALQRDRGQMARMCAAICAYADLIGETQPDKNEIHMPFPCRCLFFK
ncbi:unnamed protein product [Vitrella brassicaformis CCMP3155]|uniref:Uncharacterized protein n=1 Tax=Vitrella brassicaformis (strain CCMP3155) TaxID=1169540 RepID=A0A0G4GW28_VITBC|nr:unnamed protein product [Vitrella brassicaformis CCMP3155]|eukprot:CEM35138.1 unnamed protein product [Vitrella brassicaformis CCMP3155]